MTVLDELKTILKQVGPDNIWRPVYDLQHNLLSLGVGKEGDGLPPNLNGLDLKDKTVVDLGCNFGHYTFWARSQTASHVLGIDIDPRIIRGCFLLRDMHDYDRVNFLAQDITRINGMDRFDIAMMIDFIGKSMVRSGALIAFLDALEKLGRNEMLLSIRPMYRIKKHLKNDLKGLTSKYPARYIRNNKFYTLEYVTQRFENKWHMTILSPKNDPYGAQKETLLFSRKQVSS